MDDRCRAAIAEVGLPISLLDRPPLSLSGGEQRLAALAALLVADPELLLLDEPTAGLAPSYVQRVLEIVRERAVHGCAVLMATHDVDVVALAADTVITLARGELVSSGSPSEAFRDVEELDRRGVPVPLAARAMYITGQAGVTRGGELSLGTAAAALASATPSNLATPAAVKLANAPEGAAGIADGIEDRAVRPKEHFGILTTLLAGGLLGASFLLPVPLWQLAVLSAASLLAGKLLGVDLKRLARMMAPVLLLGLVAGAMHVLTTPGTAIVSIWFVDISQQGISAATRTVMRVAGPVLVGLVLLGTRDAASTARSMGRLLEAPPLLRRWTRDAGAALLLTVRLIPMMRSEVTRVDRAQLARGVDRRSGSLPRRTLALLGVVAPALVGALQHAERLAITLYLRGFTAARGRPGQREPFWSLRDAPWLAIAGAVFAGALLTSLR